MALAAGPEKQVGKPVVTDIGLLLPGALEAPIRDAEAGYGTGMVAIHGIVRCGHSRNTLPVERVPDLTSTGHAD